MRRTRLSGFPTIAPSDHAIRSGFPVALLVLLFVTATVAGTVHAAPSPDYPGAIAGEGTIAEVSVYSDTNTIRPGETFSLVVWFRLKPKWHIYWKNPGNAGMATDLTVEGPDGFRTGSMRWPRPVEFRTGEIITYGYRDQTMLFVPVTAPEDLPDEPYSFDVAIQFLACKDRCFMHSRDMTVEVPRDAVTDEHAEAVSAYRGAVPKPFEKLEEGKISWSESGLVLTGMLPSPDADPVQFFPVAVPGVEPGDPNITVDDGQFRVVIPVSWNPDNHQGEREPAVQGVLTFGTDDTGPAYEFSVPLKTDR